MSDKVKYPDPGTALYDAWDEVTRCFFDDVRTRLGQGESSNSILPEIKSYFAFNDIVSDLISDYLNSTFYPWNRNEKK